MPKKHSYPQGPVSHIPQHLQDANKNPVTLELIKEMTKEQPSTLPQLHPKLGVGHFALPLQRLHFSYCSHNGDSQGLM